MPLFRQCPSTRAAVVLLASALPIPVLGALLLGGLLTSREAYVGMSCALMLSLVMAWQWQACCVDPLAKLADLAQRIGQGERRLRADLAGAGCSTDLAQALNDMLDAMQRDALRERQIAARQHESEKQEALGALAGGFARDVDNMITALLGHAALARTAMQADPDSARTRLQEIERIASLGRTLVQQAMIYSRQSAPAYTVQPLLPIVQQTAAQARALLPPEVNFTVSFAADFADSPLPVRANAPQFTQMLLQLCLGAWHSRRPSSGRIELTLAQMALDDDAAADHPGLSPGQHAVITVHDRDHDTDAATRSKLFDPYAMPQADSFGLASVAGIVRSHGGHLATESAPGEGTTFRILLPVATPTDGADANDDHTEADIDTTEHDDAIPPPAPNASNPTRQVLYVDDDESLIYLVSRLLREAGIPVKAFTVPEQALEALRLDPGAYDLVVTDQNMPGLSGVELAREIRAIRPGLPVVIFSGHLTGELYHQARDAGVREVIAKPDDVADMRESIARVLNADRRST